MLVIRSEVLLCTRWRAHTVYSKGVLTRHAHHGVRTTQRLAVAAAAASSLLLRPRLVPTRSSRFPRCRGRKGTGLPPVPQLRGPRSTTSPRSPASSSSWTRLVRRPRLAPAPPLTQHRSCAHPWQAPRPRDGRCRSWLTRYDEVRAHAGREHAARAAARGASHAQEISNAWVAAGGARLLQARQFPRAVSASASVAHRTNEKISWRPCKCL